MILIVGTSHVSRKSAKDVREAIAEADIVCLELDRARLEGLLTKRQAAFRELQSVLGMKAAVMASVLRWIQQKIGKSVGVLPGAEMRAAFEEATKQKKNVALIDRDVRITMQRLSKAFGWKEVWQMLKDLRPRKVPAHPSDELVLELMGELREKYPRIYKVMVAERDIHMARVLVHILSQNPQKTIVAVVGKGHTKGLMHHINYLNKEAAVKLWSSQERSS